MNHLRPRFAGPRNPGASNGGQDRSRENSNGSGKQGVDQSTSTSTSTATSTASLPFEGLSIQNHPVSKEVMLRRGLELVGFEDRIDGSDTVNTRRFRAFFGVGPKALASMYSDLCDRPMLATFLMTLNWLKLYDREHVLAGRWKLDEKTIRDRVKRTVKLIQALKHTKITWENYDDDELWIISVDGVHCRIQEVRKDPGAKWYDHKTNSAGVSYEVALGIRSGRIVWMKGPFPASRHNLTTFSTMKGKLLSTRSLME